MRIVRTVLLLSGLLILAGQAKIERRYPNLNITCITPEVTDFSTVYLFSHGVDPRKNTGIRQAQEYIKHGIIHGVCYTFNYNDTFSSINFGQEDDYARLAIAYRYICALHPTSNIILVGLSRGSVAILHFLAMHDPEQLRPIKAIVLESPFDTLDNVIEHVSEGYCWMVPQGTNALKKLIGKLPNYKTYGLQPLWYAQQIMCDIPFLITYSLTDRVVPAPGTRRIIRALQRNKNSVTIVELQEGKHSTASSDKRFQDAARTFLSPLKAAVS